MSTSLFNHSSIFDRSNKDSDTDLDDDQLRPPPPTPPPSPAPLPADLFRDIQHDAIAGEIDNGLFVSPTTDPEHILHLGSWRAKWASQAANHLEISQVTMLRLETGCETTRPQYSYVHPRIEFCEHDIEYMCDQGKTYDFIFMREILEVTTEVAAAEIIQKAARLLKPGGYFEVQTFVRCFERCKVGNASDLVGDVFERAKQLGQDVVSMTPWKDLMGDAGLETQESMLCSSTFTGDFAAFLPEYLDDLADLALMAAEALKGPEMKNYIRLQVICGRKPAD